MDDMSNTEYTVKEINKPTVAEVDAENFMGDLVISEPGSDDGGDRSDEKEEAKSKSEERPASNRESVVVTAHDSGKKLLIDSQHISMVKIGKQSLYKPVRFEAENNLPNSYIVWRDPATLLVS